MSINSVLKKEGISIVRKLNMLEINRIAKNISDKIIKYYSEFFLDYNDLFSKISRVDMYLAKMPNDSAYAKYSYTCNSIFFNDTIDLEISENSIFAIHECIHYLQTKTDEKGMVTKLGFYDLGRHGNAINEAAVQLAASKSLEKQIDNVKYYDIYINTISPDSYPLQCALVNEMAYFTGEYPLFHSMFNSNDVFKNTFISCSNAKTYDNILQNLDNLLQLEDDLYYYNIELLNTAKQKDVKLLTHIINSTKAKIKKTFFETQNIIIQNCFTKEFDNIQNLEDIKAFQNKLYNFKNVLSYSDDYTYYNEFYCNTMQSLEKMRDMLDNGTSLSEYRAKNNSLAVITNNKINIFKLIFSKIKKLFSFNKQKSSDYIN